MTRRILDRLILEGWRPTLARWSFEPADQQCETHFGWVGVFWFAIVAGLLTLAAIQVATDQPSLWRSGNGLLTGALILAYAGWFLATMRLRRQLAPHVRQFGPWKVYAWLAAGIALTVGLVLLHGAFVSLAYADIGMALMASSGIRASLPPLAVLIALLIYGTGMFRYAPLPQVAGELLSLASVVAIVSSLNVVLRQRAERDQLIAELRAAHEELRVSAAREVELAALRERNRLAREMHDSLGHALVLIGIKIEAAQRIQAIDPERAAREWEETKALVRDTMGELRRSLAGLRLQALEEHPFGEALAELSSDLGARSGVEMTVLVPVESKTLDRRVQEALYRVAQEALTNVAKHARAHHASVTVHLDPGSPVSTCRAARLEVADDGVGLEVAPRSNRGYGVVGMRERVEALGGVLTLGPNPNGGTVLCASVPLQDTNRRSSREERSEDVRDPHPVS